MNDFVSLFRRAVAAAIGLSLPCFALAQSATERLPQRNLLIELRRSDGSNTSATGGGLRTGTVIVGPNGAVQTRAEVGVGTRQIEQASDGVGALRVLNGSQGMLSTGYSVPVTWYSVAQTTSGQTAGGATQGTDTGTNTGAGTGARTPQQGIVATPGLVEVGRRVAVRPRWPGGHAPVTVEIRSEASVMAGGAMTSRFGLDGRPLPENATESAGLLTTLQLPLGEWVTVAGGTNAPMRSEQGTVYRTEIRSQGESLLQMRVTAP